MDETQVREDICKRMEPEELLEAHAIPRPF
jgi:hypothetical protein